MCKFPNQFNTIVLSYKCKLFFQRVLLSLSSLNSILFPLCFEKVVSISSSQLNKAPAVIITFRYEEAEPLCGLPPSLSFWITGKGRSATTTCWLQNHRCLFFFPLKINYLLGTTLFSHMSCYQFLLLLLLFFLVLTFVSSPLPPTQSINFNEISCSANFFMAT